MHVHCIGICGTGMGSLAGLFQAAGHKVTGSDTGCYPPMSTMLERLGIEVLPDFKVEHLSPAPDLVIIGNICTSNNPEARAAIDGGMKYLSMPHAVAEYFGATRTVVMMTGTHGKTTCSSLGAWLLEAAGRDPAFLVGGIPRNFDVSYKLGNGGEFVVEGDEYDTAFYEKTPKFLHYGAKAVHLGPVEFDHADIYADLDAVLEEFRKLIVGIPSDGLLVACADSSHVVNLLKHANCKVLTYSVHSDGNADYTVDAVEMGPAGTKFNLCFNKDIEQMTSPLVGSHNLQNALGVLVLLNQLGVSWNALRIGLKDFKGIKRRQEVIGTPKGITIVDDFAHHPTAIKETISGLLMQYPNKRLLIAFEPRSNTSGRSIFHDAYLQAFSGSTKVWIAPVRKLDRIPENERLDIPSLVSQLKANNIPAVAAESTEQITQELRFFAKRGDVIVIMSNGAFDGIYKTLLKTL